MRVCSIVTGLVLGGSMGLGAAGAGAATTHAPRPPVITEKFTLEPCVAHPVSTVDFARCQGHAIVKADSLINQEERSLFVTVSKIPWGATAAERRLAMSEIEGDLVSSARAWLTYRNRECLSESDALFGGSGSQLVEGECLEQLDKARLTQLKTLFHP